MYSQDSSDGQQCSLVVSVETSSQFACDEVITVTIGATVPTGFENTAAEEVQEKIGANARISKDRGRIYFKITTDKLAQVHQLRSVDNLFVVVEEYDNYHFKDSKEEALDDLQKLACKLPWSNALKVWNLNSSLKRKRGPHRRPQGPRGRGGRARGKANKDTLEAGTVEAGTVEAGTVEAGTVEAGKVEAGKVEAGTVESVTVETEKLEISLQDGQREMECQGPGAKVLKFRVTCNRAGDKHSFSSNEAARDFGGAVQDFFQWKADMTKFDIEVLLNIHNVEVVIGIALTEESLHRRNISHFGPTTLRSTLCYGMLRSPVLTTHQFNQHLTAL